MTIFGTSNYTNSQWIPNPNNRGTWDLIQTCIITLGLCVYSALHLNVFDHQCPWWHRWLIRFKWMVIALLAPEFIVYNAWFQHRQASRIAQVLRRRSGQTEPESFMAFLRRYILGRSTVNELDQNQQKDHEKGFQSSVHEDENITSREPFQLAHGFLIVMGGLVVDMTDDEHRVWPEWCNNLTITPACIEECLDSDAFKNINLDFLTLESIEGRSKVDSFTKFLVILQALWFCIQFLVRVHQALPALGDPFVVSTSESQALGDLCAAQWTLGAAGMHYEKHVLQQTDHSGMIFSSWTPSFTHGGTDSLLTIFRGRRGITLSPGSGEDWYLFHHDTERWLYFPRHPRTAQLRLRTRCPFPQHHHKAPKEPLFRRLQAHQLIPHTDVRIDAQFASIEVDSITLERWRRTLNGPRHYQCNYSVWLRDRQPNFCWPRGLDSADGPVIAAELTKSALMFLATSLCYGAMHLFAWDADVMRPRSAQETFWRLSCLLLVGAVGFCRLGGFEDLARAGCASPAQSGDECCAGYAVYWPHLG
ncbi:hypothetical protein AWENTII_008052 [Aspergillus wentii]